MNDEVVFKVIILKGLIKVIKLNLEFHKDMKL